MTPASFSLAKVFVAKLLRAAHPSLSPPRTPPAHVWLLSSPHQSASAIALPFEHKIQRICRVSQ
ncbi:hypothetical protein L207DRAFT_515102 [Hyaloscypha variabilis F]|uniref:Uncharacterized protein n=1 Tax=Hyaloscypha variabilis (strain UAMH 11265 / GT02V1 / F) TaxID=1149755 RepID=A0A2J6RDL6_HYAVF|nr:hypothetical protein L207DRAFT_515102 [Hyaloscypha variabilis F]